MQSASSLDRAARAFAMDASVLARLVPPSVVAEVLAEAGVAGRTRRTSAVTGVYLALGMVLFPAVSIPRVFEKLSGVLGRGGSAVPTKSSLAQRRLAVGAVPLRALFCRLRGAGPQLAGSRWRGFEVCAIDGTTLEVPDGAANREAFGRKSNQTGAGAFPLVRLLVLVACGTRSVIDAVFDGVRVGEPTLAFGLVGALKPGMLVLADRGYGGWLLWVRCAGSGADLLWRFTGLHVLPAWRALPDGSYLCWRYPSSTRKADRVGLPDKVLVRVVVGFITVVDEDGVRRSERYRLVTTLLDHEAYPAAELLRLYGRRWQVELMIKGLKCTQLGGFRLRSKNADGVRQEVWAALCVHQLLRAEAARAAADTDAEIRQINLTVLADRLGDAIVRTAGRRGLDAATALADLRWATAEDITPIDTRIRIFGRAVKHPVAKFPSKKPAHRGRRVVFEYGITPAPEPATNTAQTPSPVVNYQADTLINC